MQVEADTKRPTVYLLWPYEAEFWNKQENQNAYGWSFFNLFTLNHDYNLFTSVLLDNLFTDIGKEISA